MIFLDNASTTKLSEIAKNEIIKSQDLFYNPSAVYNAGFEIKNKIIDAKKAICVALGTMYNDNLIITGSATEANNLAIFGSIKKTNEQLLFSVGEHPSVYNCALELKARGYNVKFIPLTETGEVDINELNILLNEPTAFVSIMHVSNETGAINDISKLVKLVKQKQPSAIFHCDGAQAFGKIPVNVSNLGVDLYTISAHKIHGPKGIGALYIKNIKKIKPIIFGGGQELGIRSGTENTQYILAFSQIAQNLNIKENYEKVTILNKYVRDFFENNEEISPRTSFGRNDTNLDEEISPRTSFGRNDTNLDDEISPHTSFGRNDTEGCVIPSAVEESHPFCPDVEIQPHITLNSPENASPYILSLSFEGVRGETLVHMLEDKGVIVGTGSACSSKKGSLNRTLEAMKRNKSQNEGAIRISFSSDNTLTEIKTACITILDSYNNLFRFIT